MGSITTWNITQIPKNELLARREKVFSVPEAQDAEGFLFFSAEARQYLLGFQFIDTERPMAYILKRDGTSTAFVPWLEQDHVEDFVPSVNTVRSYREYPGQEHPMQLLAKLLADLGLANKTIVVDSDGYPSHFGYTGPAVSSLCPDMKVIHLPQIIQHLKRVKSPYDISVIKEATRWGNLAHTLLHEYTKPGLKEIEVEHRVLAEATRVMLLTLGQDFKPGANIQARADYRGQIGTDTYYPHSVTTNATFKAGDILGTGAGASMLGYNSELERNIFIGEPSPEMRKYYQHVIALQELAFSIIRPGIPCSQVDKELTKYFNDQGLIQYWRHHTGHSLGMGMHEAPYFDSYDDTIIESGMVFSVEPGIYVKGLGGFRLSDTVLVTDTGIEQITYYPRDIERNIIA
jgi:Xaa-Pro aminopeptidase